MKGFCNWECSNSSNRSIRHPGSRNWKRQDAGLPAPPPRQGIPFERGHLASWSWTQCDSLEPPTGCGGCPWSRAGVSNIQRGQRFMHGSWVSGRWSAIKSKVRNKRKSILFTFCKTTNYICSIGSDVISGTHFHSMGLNVRLVLGGNVDEKIKRRLRPTDVLVGTAGALSKMFGRKFYRRYSIQ